jgi:ADP-heptose:LPS heptosyltransferase
LGDEALWDLKLNAGEFAASAARLRGVGITGPFVAASVGTKVPANHWTTENWRRLFARLGERAADLALVILGAPDERSEADLCLEAWPGRGANLCGATSPREAAALLRGASLYLGHDSGLLHLAALVGTPCIGIYSARNPPGQWYPKGTQHRIFYRQVECFGCQLTQCVAHAKKCILSVTPSEVAAAALHQLAGTDPNSRLQEPAC